MKEVWKVQISPKLKLFIWKIKHEALPVGDRLAARHITNEAKCIHCNGTETIVHLFFQCPYAQKVWELVPLSGGFIPTPLNSFDEEWRKLLQAVTLPPTDLGNCPLSPWIFWSLWAARNQKLF